MAFMRLLDTRLTLGIAVSIPLVISVVNYYFKKKSEKKPHVEFGQTIIPLLVTPEDINNGYEDKKYMPFRYPHNQTMSLCKMDMNYWAIMNHQYVRFQEEKSKIFENYDAEKLKNSSFFKKMDGYDAEFIELMEFVVDHYTARFPLLFERTKENDRIVENKLTGEFLNMDTMDPLVVTTKITMEDFYVCQKNADDGGFYCIGTTVAFGGGGFPIVPIVGKEMDFIHKRVPYYEEKLKTSMNKWFDRFEQPAERVAWHIVWDGELHCSDLYPQSRNLSHHDFTEYVSKIPFEKFKVRMEKQTLIKLPKTKAILFINHPIFVDIAREGRDEPMVPSIILKVMYEAPKDIITFRHYECIRDHLKPYLEEMIDYQIEKGLIGKEEKVRTISNYPYAAWVKNLTNWSLKKGFTNPHLNL